VAAYCRVSSADTEQMGSLNLQKRYYESLIKENPEWLFAGIYADIGSGTQVKGRTAFQDD
jgi:site-specific DNA recombinase